MLDQRVTGQRPDHIDARAGRLEGRREPGKGLAILAGEDDAAAFDKCARRGRTHARDHPVAADRLLPVARVEQQLTGAHLGRRGPSADGQPAGGRRLVEQFDIGRLGAREIGRAVEDGDDIALRRIGGEAERILDSRIARADHGDMLVDIFAGVVELILDMRRVGAGAGHQVRVALRADRQHHRLRRDRAVILERQGKVALVAGDCGHLAAVPHVDARGAFTPRTEDHLALAGGERHVGTQHQLAGRRHDMLALLVFVDRVGEVIGLFEQHMAKPERGSARGGAQPGRA